MNSKRIILRFIAFAFALCSNMAVKADEKPELALAGYAYVGSETQIATRFPYSRRYEQMRQATGSPIYQDLVTSLNVVSPKYFRISAQIESLRGRDQALAAALVIGNETVSIEQFGSLRKLSVIIRAQAMIFDFKSMNVVRSYPLSFAYIDLFNHAPTSEEIDTRVKHVFEGINGKPGLITT